MKRRADWLVVAAVVLAIPTLAQLLGWLPELVGRLTGPAVMACIVAWVWATRGQGVAHDKHLVLAALMVSLVADIILKFSFVFGLAVFLIMQIIYIVLFVRRGGLSRYITWPMVGYGAIVGLVVPLIWPEVRPSMMLTIAVPCGRTAAAARWWVAA